MLRSSTSIPCLFVCLFVLLIFHSIEQTLRFSTLEGVKLIELCTSPLMYGVELTVIDISTYANGYQEHL